MSELLHPIIPSRHQQHAIYKETKEIRNDSCDDAPENYTAQVDFSHTTPFSIR